ncbi:MAG: type II/IV secretion system protein [Polyangiaceae bacterium]|nr:type II/IV secretion system protein [Polyangiaceae bacterium]
MNALGRVAVWLAALASLVAVGALLLAGGAESAEVLGSRARALHASSLGPAVWQWLLRAAVLAWAVFFVLRGLEAWVRRRPSAPRPAFEAAAGSTVDEQLVETRRRIEECAEGRGHVVELLDELLKGAVRAQASDVHVSPSADGVRLTLRVQGQLHEVAALPLEFAPLLATRIKVLARLDTVARTPQDGRLVTGVEGGNIEARVSTLPTENGERVALRIVRGSRDVLQLDALGFQPDMLGKLEQVLARPQGLLFVTGPVGSGKTTTLYACLEHIARTRGRTTTLVTLEDPIELELPFATQTQMHPKAGMTFASVLRSVLRQDPNVLMLGEIRDRETAEIAMQAGLTGHLILTTVHGQSTAGVFARLVDVGVEPFVLASATLGCLSQRLVRTLCLACRAQQRPERLVVDRFASLGVTLDDSPQWHAVGCDFCRGQGYVGQVPIAELLVMDDALRAAVHARRATDDVHRLARDAGMRALVSDGLRRVSSGETSLSEVLRVAG